MEALVFWPIIIVLGLYWWIQDMVEEGKQKKEYERTRPAREAAQALRARELSRRQWILEHGTTEERTLAQLEIQNELLRQQNELTRHVGQAVAWGNMMDAGHRLDDRH